MNTRQIGNQYELKALHELKAAGFLVERAQGKVLWIPKDRKNPRGPRIPITKHIDFFGAFDLIATSSYRIRMIQVAFMSDTDGGDLAEKRRKIEDVAPFLPQLTELELWRWQQRRAMEGKRVRNGWTKQFLSRAATSPKYWKWVDQEA